MHVQVRLFGDLAIVADGRSLEAGYARGELLLAWLALHPEEAWSRERLAELLWPEQPDGVGRRRLREVLFRLRRAIGDGERAEALITAARKHVTLHAGPDLDVDVWRFDALLAEVDEHRHVDVCACLPCLERLEQATRLYDGPLLRDEELPHGEATEGIARERERRAEGLLRATALLGERSLRDGRWGAALDLAARMLTHDPLSEPGARLKMRALSGAGRQVEAVEAYDALVQGLELTGRVPADETEELYQSLVHHEYSPEEVRVSPLRVPAPVSPLIGRSGEVRWLLDHLGQPDVRLISLVGLGGAGKTRLAIEVARRSAPTWRDGVWFVSAVECETGADLLVAIRASLGLQGRSTDTIGELLAWLEGRVVLWVLDNLEQVDGAPEVIDEMLRGASGLHILATSRHRLGLRAEHLRSLGGLETANAITLWTQRAHQLVPDVEAPPELVEDLCTSLGGLPLAIEMAASRTPESSCDEILASLRGGLSLSSPFADVPRRQASMQTVLSSAVEGLGPDALHALGALTVFRGAFTARAAAEVCGLASDELHPLVLRSLLSPSGERYTMLPIVAAYARETRPAPQSVRVAHRRWFLAGPPCPAPEAHLERNDLGHAWRSAWQDGDVQLIADTVVGLAARLRRLGWLPEAARWFNEASEALLAQHPGSAATRRTFACAGLSTFIVGDGDLARSRLVRAVELSRQSEAVADLVLAQDWLAFVERNLGHPDTARRLAREVLELAESHGLEKAAELRYHYATALYESGELGEAREQLSLAAEQLDAIGDDQQSAAAVGVLGLCEVLLGDHRGGLERLASAAAVLRSHGGVDLYNHLNAWACAALIAGRPRDARHRARAALTGFGELEFPAGVASTSVWLAIGEAMCGSRDGVRGATKNAVAACLAAGSERAYLEAACALAWWYRSTDPELAAKLRDTVLAHPEHIAELRALMQPLTELEGGEPLSADGLFDLLLRVDGTQGLEAPGLHL